MSKKNAVPDAWEDDWETIADKTEPTVGRPEPAPAPAPKLSKTQRRAQHLEQQKQLWDSADNPDRFHWLETQGVVPLKQEFKAPVQLLSRKPNAHVIAKNTDGVAKLNLDDDEDSEEEARKKRESELEDLQRQAKQQREEKQRKYAEARQRIMGGPSNNNPTSATPNSRDSSHGRENRRSRGKINGNRNSQPSSSADQSPARQQAGERQLFDPDDMGRRMPKRESSNISKDDYPVRQPRNPDRSGRGGFGFAGRGGTVAS